MIRDSKFSRRNSGKTLNFEETENVPVNSNLREPSIARLSTDIYSRPPLNTVHEPSQNPSKSEHELGFKSSKIYRTPTKPKLRNPESGIQMKTPDKQGAFARIGSLNTPRSSRTVGRHSLGFSEANSTHCTPTKSAIKPPNPGLVYGGCSRPPVNGGTRVSNFSALSKGIPVNYNNYTTVNTVDVPHFDLKEDPSFWMDHNVQVLIRVRPLNNMEISSQGYNRCLKQESAQSLTWVGHPETRFTFDHVACETVDQETLFKMVGLPMVENCLSGYNSCMFAYGQTGSGKTHTMLGEINDLEVKPSPYRGMTPRIFEFLFARIVAEEESRKDERLAYNCKCSFLEIYNEQITDLLNPSSTNLQLREDVKTGVYVENLMEYKVNNVGDILKLLSQGSANRRVAATNMNRESSRSHSVFTCVIESRWEKDSTSNLRYARLNLVDLAGSERQKSSGAEGERLKEAANINKSLSTLGHVIMVLVEGANARTRHVPYRDSRLTFLLQDSLGGNSKTMIIANVSPSLSSAIETLNTLKFAQRAKLIQNNAVINEDASGDVTALQHQIRLLKEEIAILKRPNISRSLTFSSKDENCSNTSSLDDDKVLRVSCKQLKSLETSLNGALRREKSTENSIKQLETEIQQLNCLVGQREEENRLTKMMLKFREDKIQKMESVIGGLIPVDSYLLEENKILNEEIQILHAKIDKNPEVTRFALENIRLLEQLKRFQDFYEEGEREILLTEVSELRDQLVHSQQDNCINPSIEKLKKSQEELHKCLEKNEELSREIINLNALLEIQKSHNNSDIEVIKEEVMDLQLETEILKTILKEERSIHAETEEKLLFITKEYEKSKSVIEALEIQQLVSIDELQDLKNKKYDEILHENELKMKSLNRKIINQESRNRFYTSNEEINSFQRQISEIMLKEKETRQELTKKSQEFDFLTCKREREMKERILKEKETQQELTFLQEHNKKLTEKCDEFDLLMNNIEEVLTVGCEALDCASNEFGNGKRKWVSEKLEILARNVTEKELKIEELSACLEDAKVKGGEMEIMLRSLKGATLIMSEANQVDLIKKDEEIERLLLQLNQKNNIIIQLEEQIQVYEVEFMDSKINASQQEVESCCYFDKFVETQHNNINKKEADLLINNKNEELLMEKLFTKEIELLIVSSRLEQVNQENIRVLEKFKEEIIVSYVDMHLKDLILVEKDEEISLLHEENEKLVVLIKNHKHEIEEFDAENVVKSDVFEGELMGNMALISNLEADILRECEFNALLNSEMKEQELTERQLKVDLDDKSILIKSLKGYLTNVVCEKDDLYFELLRARNELEIATQQYELELTDEKVNSAQHEVESFCYLDRFIETQHQSNNADFIINKLVNENERMKIDISDLINANNTLKNSYSLEEKHLKEEIDELEHIILQIHLKKILEQEVLEDLLMKNLCAKEIEVSFMLEKIEQIASESNHLQEALEQSKKYFVKKESEIIFYEKSVEDLKCLVDELENQAVKLKGGAAKQRLQMEELEVELEKIREQEELLKIENDMLKSENENQKMKLVEIEDELNKLSNFQRILAKTKVFSQSHESPEDNPQSTQPCQVSNPDPTNTNESPKFPIEIAQPELPIALRKGSRACTLNSKSRRRTMF